MQVASKFVQLWTTNAEHFQANKMPKKQKWQKDEFKPRGAFLKVEKNWLHDRRLTIRYSETAERYVGMTGARPDYTTTMVLHSSMVSSFKWTDAWCTYRAYAVTKLETKSVDGRSTRSVMDCIKFSSTRTIESKRCERPVGAPGDDRGTGSAMGRCWLQTSRTQNCTRKLTRSSATAEKQRVSCAYMRSWRAVSLR